MAHTPQDVLDRLAALENEVRHLRGRAQMRPAMNQILHGEVAIGEGGSLAVYPPGHVPGQDSAVFATGEWVSAEGVTSYGVAMRREDGTQALAVGGNAAGAHPMVRMFAADGGVIVAEDAYAAGYLGRPWVPVPMATSRDVTSTSWQTTHIGRVWAQHAVLVASWSLYSDSGTTAESRLRIEDSSGLRQLGDTLTTPGGTETFSTQRFTATDHGLAYGEVASLYLQARVTGGSGTASLWHRGVWGDNTNNATEA